MLEVIEIPCGCGQHVLTFAVVPAVAVTETPYIPPSPNLREIYERGLTDSRLVALHKHFRHGALGGAS